MKASVITLSDRISRGEAVDISGETLVKLVEANGFEILCYRILPDEKSLIERTLIELSDVGSDLILTTGGTGLSLRDVTPEATIAICDREDPGIADLIRLESMKKTPFGSLSRGVSGLRGKTLIINFPGSPKSVEECFSIISPILFHALCMLKGEGHENEQYIKGEK